MSDAKPDDDDRNRAARTGPTLVRTRRELLIAVLILQVSFVALTVLRVREWAVAPLLAFGLPLAAWVIAVVVIERRLPRLSLAALRGRNEGFSVGRALAFYLLWMVIGFGAIILNPSSPTLREWASRAWADVQFWTAAAVAAILAIGLPGPSPGSIIGRAVGQVERVGHFIDEGRFLTREEASSPSAPTPPSTHDIPAR